MKGTGQKLMKSRLVLLFLLISMLSLSSCFPLAPKNDPYQIRTFPIDGKYIRIIGSNDHKICYYSYDLDSNNKIIQKKLDIVDYDFRSLEQKVIYTIITSNKNFVDFQKELIGASYNQLEEPILFYQTFNNGVSNIFSIYYKQEQLLYSQKSNTFPSFRGFFFKPDHNIRFNYLLLLYSIGVNKTRFVIDSIENGNLKTIDFQGVDLSLYETNQYIFFFSNSEAKQKKIYAFNKTSLIISKVGEYKSGKIVGIDFSEDYVLINNEEKNSIEIVDIHGIIGIIPCTYPQENINFIVSKKFQHYYSFFVLLHTTTDGIDTKVPWIRYYPKSKKVIQKDIKLPVEYEIYATKYYERKNDEFIAVGMKRESREMNLLFFYFSKGKISYEPLHHKVDQNMTIRSFTYNPGYYFTWSEYTKMEKYSDFNYQVYYCSLNRLQSVLDKINRKP